MFKKILSFVLAFVMVASMCMAFASCDSGKNADFKLGVILLHDEFSTYDLNFINGIKAAAEALGLKEDQVIFKKIRTTLLNAFGGNVREIVMGGAALNPDVEKWFRKFKLPFTVGYGMTEAAPLLAYEDWYHFAPKSCGKCVDSVEVRIDSDDPYNKVGEIQAKGISLMSGYYKNEEATKASFTEDGWMRTGDLGVIDQKGNIFIKGRSKNMILSANGQNIYPEEIEAVVNNQDFVVESVVVDRGASLVALVFVDKDKIKEAGLELEAQMEVLKAEVNKSMPAYSKIAKVEVMDVPFEKTPKMSIKRFMYK